MMQIVFALDLESAFAAVDFGPRVQQSRAPLSRRETRKTLNVSWYRALKHNMFAAFSATLVDLAGEEW